MLALFATQIVSATATSPVLEQPHTIKSTAAEMLLMEGGEVVCIDRGHPEKRRAFVCLTNEEWHQVAESARRFESNWQHAASNWYLSARTRLD
jgi:hypothetical protein